MGVPIYQSADDDKSDYTTYPSGDGKTNAKFLDDGSGAQVRLSLKGEHGIIALSYLKPTVSFQDLLSYLHS